MIERIQAAAGWAGLVEPGQREAVREAAGEPAAPVDIATFRNRAGRSDATVTGADLTAEEADAALAWVRQALTDQAAPLPHDGLDADRVLRLVGLVA